MIDYQNFNYNGKKISFSKSRYANMVNANDMEKAFVGKTVRQWMDNKSTQEYIHTLASMRGYKVTKNRTSLTITELANMYPKLVYVKRGGIPNQTEQGTWLHEDLAIEFARWLSPEFAIWCNDRIKELLTQGKVELHPNMPVPMPPASLTPEQEAKIRYADACIESDIPTSFKGIASRIMLTSGKKMTRPQLMAWLYNNGYLQKNDEITNCPTQWAIDMGFFMIKMGYRQIRSDRAPRKGKNKGMPTPKGAMHIINTLSHSLPVVNND